MIVQELLELSPLRLVTALPTTTISEAARRMERFGIGLVVIMEEDDGIAGVLSERDVVYALGRNEIDLEETVVGDLMTETVVTVSPNTSIVEAILAMNSNGIRHVIAAEEGKPVGVLSIRDVLRVMARQLLDNESESNEQLTTEFVEALAA